MEKRANFLFIMADQLRADFLGYAGAHWANTPNIDRLAKSGMIFNRCYTNSPLCAPARISLATGLRPHRLGALGNDAFLPVGTPTYYQRLRNHEYYVGCVGKLDLAKPDPFNGIRGDRPCCFGWGFTHPVECEGKYHAGHQKEPIGPYTKYLHDKGKLSAFNEDYIFRGKNSGFLTCHDSVLDKNDFEDAYIGRRSVQWLREIGDDYPFHLFVSFVGPHDPFDPPAEYAELYKNADIPPRVQDYGEGKPAWIHERMTLVKGREESHYEKLRQQYCASIKAIDDAVGDILKALEERGDADNTFIIFSSDHGEMLTDHNLPIKHVASDLWKWVLV